jgi:hypothetical protein
MGHIGQSRTTITYIPHVGSKYDKGDKDEVKFLVSRYRIPIRIAQKGEKYYTLCYIVVEQGCLISDH